MYYIDNTASNIPLVFFKELCSSIDVIPIYEKEQEIRGGLFLIDEKSKIIAQVRFDQTHLFYDFLTKNLADCGITNLVTYHIIDTLPVCDFPILPSLYKLHHEVIKYVPERPKLVFAIRPIIRNRNVSEKSWFTEMVDTSVDSALFWFPDINTTEKFFKKYEKDFKLVQF